MLMGMGCFFPGTALKGDKYLYFCCPIINRNPVVMESPAPHVGEKVLNRIKRSEQEAPPYVSGTHPSTEFGEPDPVDQVRQRDLNYGYTSYRVPSYFPIDKYPHDHPGQCPPFEWYPDHCTTVCSTTTTKNRPSSIYETSSDYTVAEDVPCNSVLPSPGSSLGTFDSSTLFNSTTMVWGRFPPSENPGSNVTYCPHSIGHEQRHDSGEEMDILEDNQLPAEAELDLVLPMNSRSSFLSTIEDTTGASLATSENTSFEKPEVSPDKPRCFSAPMLRWNTSRRTRKTKLEQTTIIFPKSPASFPPKANHNSIEKQYRSRLNDKFEALLSVLPGQETQTEWGNLAKISKGDVLMLAKDYIERLEKSRDEIREDKRSLEDEFKSMQEAWRQSCGVVLH
jgi:Helix-loop-helix DNA-binding domain